MTAFFLFEGEELVCERIYFDQLTFLRQLLRGLNLRSPTGVVQLLRTLRGFARMSRGTTSEAIADPLPRGEAPR
jgi:hypothetical protein